jgi:hypothetical protein
MKVADCKKYFGSQNAFAAAIGSHPCTVSNWNNRGIPLPIQWQVELGTRGKLKADERPFLEAAQQKVLLERFRTLGQK